jgi:beta-lactam-binding protein with PASTA domain
MISVRTQILFRRAVVSLGLLLVALIAAVITMRLAIHGAEVQVPDLRGMTAADAIRRAADSGLSATIADRYYSPNMPLGNVLSQFPEPGTRVRRDWIVRLVESLGPQSISVPDVTGMTQRDAVIALRQAHLDLGTVAVLPYAGAAPGTVIAQDPSAAAKEVDRPRVAILLASGTSAAAGVSPEAATAIMVPNVVGLPFHEAAQQVLRAGFKLAPVSNSLLPRAPGTTGIVLSQSPRAGSSLRSGAAITLTLGR